VIRKIARNGSRVTVMQSAPFLETLAEMPGELSPELHGDDETAETSVTAVVSRLKSEGISADGFTDIGQSGLIIAAAAERIDASLILLPLRHPRWILALHRISPIPILAVPSGPRNCSSQILVPIEDRNSLEAIPYAALLARTFRVGITFVGTAAQTLLPEARERAHRELATTEVTLIADDLASTLPALPAVMIVMKTSSEEVVTQLVRGSRCPLLLIRRPMAPASGSPPATHQARSAPWYRPMEGVGEP